MAVPFFTARLTRRALPLGAAMLIAATVAACGGSQEEAAAPAASAPTANPVDPATAADITGSIKLAGTAPKNEPLEMNSDPYCMGQGGGSTETVLVGTAGELQNVFVYVKDGLGNLQFPVPATPVTLDQRGCMYRPHVFGIQVGQPLEIVNSDETLHNVHAIPESNREFNRGQALKGMKHTHTFSTTEVLVPFKCDVHKWMTAFVGVVDHPFHAVTGASGAFQLKGLPPGTYTVEAVHETLGRQTQTVTIGAGETKDLAFTFKS